MAYRKRDDNMRVQRMSSFANEFDRYMEKHVPKASHIGFALQRAWENTASPHVLEHTDTVMFCKREKEPVVLVYVDDSTWAAELNMQKEFYRIKLQEILGRPITEVRFFVSRITALRKK